MPKVADAQCLEVKKKARGLKKNVSMFEEKNFPRYFLKKWPEVLDDKLFHCADFRHGFDPKELEKCILKTLRSTNIRLLLLASKSSF